MNCQKCGGLMVADHDPESPTGVRCVNCGSQGAIAMIATQTDCKKPNCPDPKAEDSVYCIKHRDQKRAANERAAAKRKGGAPPAPKKAIVIRPPRIGVEVAAPRLKDPPPPSPAKQGNGHPGRNHVELTAAYIRETIARLQSEVRQLEQTLSVLDALAVPPA